MPRVAVVFGASRGIGQCIAQALEGSGMVVAPVARTSPGFRADVSCAADVLRVKAEIEAAMGTPTVLVNAAGVFGPISLIKDGDPEEWIRTLMINTAAAYLTCRAFVGGMIDAGRGRTVNVSSAASLHTPGPLNSAYATSKVALNQFTRHLAAALEGTGVTANVIHPGEVKTEMWADIRDKTTFFHGVDGGSHPWVALVDETGGDPPAKAAKLVLDIIGGDVNGSFLWIDDPLRPPIPSWGGGGDGR